METISILNATTLAMATGLYLLTALQWSNYSLARVVFHHHKKLWHLYYFILPLGLYYFQNEFYFVALIVYLPLFIWWYSRLDKKLNFTSRVKRFCVLFVVVFAVVYTMCFTSGCEFYPVLLPLMAVVFVSNIWESVIMLKFKHQARHKLKDMPHLKIVLITASYGKTSIKNYLYETLSTKYSCHMTPRSVNTINGIIQDINDNLSQTHHCYIAEAGARQKGDILQITQLLQPQYVIIGQIGPAHIEYFKTIDNIILTKTEALQSSRLDVAIVHDSVPLLKYDNIQKFGLDKKDITCSIKEKLKFSFTIDGETIDISAPLLGKFNATNLYAVCLMSLKLGLNIEQIQKSFANIKPVSHRLELIKANGKTILDDSFNGNIDGMLEAIDISSGFDGVKTIVTCGLVESTTQANKKLCHAIEQVFDLVILTSGLNEKTFKDIISPDKLLILRDKTQLVGTLAHKTNTGELILFANDAPSYV